MAEPPLQTSSESAQEPETRIVPSPQPAQEPETLIVPSPQPAPLPEAPIEPPYKLIRKITETSSSTIYEAERNNQRIALKKSRKEDIKIEAYYLMMARHPNIVHCNGLLLSSDLIVVMSMEYMDRGDLSNYLKSESNTKSGASKNPERVSLMLDFLKGLAFLHTVNLIHRDIKCSNVFLSSTGGQLIAKIGDFGYARRIGPNHKHYQSERVYGTTSCIAPEVFESHRVHVDTRSGMRTVNMHQWTQKADVYGAGTVLLRTACDDKPEIYDHVDNLSVALSMNRRGAIPEIHPEVTESQRELILWCFKPLGERPSSAELLHKYQQIQEQNLSNTQSAPVTQLSM
jgi:serine/threonine protein kinase